jgi:iron(III) transport system ATP-binding protein
MREEIRRIHQTTQITTVYVTHDQKEALSLAGRIAVLREGRVEQIGEPREVYRAPSSRFVADFLGETNWVKTKVLLRDDKHLRLATADGEFRAPLVNGFEEGQTAWLGFRPEAVRLRDSAPNTFDARIAQKTYLGEIEQYELILRSGLRLKAIEANPATVRAVGDHLPIHVDPSDCFVLED